MRIEAGDIPSRPAKPEAGDIPQGKCFSFSFRFWEQPEAFGIGGVDVGWHVSLLERLKQLSRERVHRFIADTVFQSEMRYHEVDWDAKNAPLSRSDLKWVPRKYLENLDEYPIFQLHLSKATGRLVGFWDEEWCFNIVLLDPLHNLNPHSMVNYKVRPTIAGSCEFSSLKSNLDRACSQPCESNSCRFAQAVRSIANQPIPESRIIVATITPDVADKFDQLRQNRHVSISDCLEHGIVFFEMD
jgi:hypothetical protein